MMIGAFCLRREGQGMAKRDRTVEYDPDFTTKGKPRKQYRAPTKKQQKLRKQNDALEAQGLARRRHLINPNRKQRLPGVKQYTYNVMLRFTAEQHEYLQQKAFREGLSMAEWMRRLLDAVRMADGDMPTPLPKVPKPRRKKTETEIEDGGKERGQ